MWGQKWGEMIWGATAVPLMGPYGFVAMAICFLVGGVVMQSRHRSHWLAPMATTALVVGPLVAVAVTLPHTFSNGTVADANQVNANFNAVVAELNGINGTIRNYINANCRIYLGWRDNCDGCSSAPVKWGYVNDTSCVNGAGTNNTCSMPNLGGEVVQTFGLNTDGSVDDSDKFYVGLHCL